MQPLQNITIAGCSLSLSNKRTLFLHMLHFQSPMEYRNHSKHLTTLFLSLLLKFEWSHGYVLRPFYISRTPVCYVLLDEYETLIAKDFCKHDGTVPLRRAVVFSCASMTARSLRVLLSLTWDRGRQSFKQTWRRESSSYHRKSMTL